MANGQDFNGEVIHCGNVRMDVNGDGNLKLAVYSKFDERSKVIAPIVLEPEGSYEPSRPVNFQNQKMQLEFKTVLINEYIVLDKIVMFLKPVAGNLPTR